MMSLSLVFGTLSAKAAVGDSCATHELTSLVCELDREDTSVREARVVNIKSFTTCVDKVSGELKAINVQSINGQIDGRVSVKKYTNQHNDGVSGYKLEEIGGSVVFPVVAHQIAKIYRVGGSKTGSHISENLFEAKFNCESTFIKRRQ